MCDTGARFLAALNALRCTRGRLQAEAERHCPNNASSGDLHVLDIVAETALISMNELAAQMCVTAGSATLAVNRLLQSGWVVRVRDPQDRRVIRVRTTPKGQRVREGYRDVLLREIRNLIARLSPNECEHFVELAERLTSPGGR